MGLRFAGHDNKLGIGLRLLPGELDPRIAEVTAHLRDGHDFFWSNSDAAQHAIRAVSRIRLLSTVNTNRNDAAGCHDIDVDASSQKIWKQFVASLGIVDARLLAVFRGGASSTLTRKSREITYCEFCRKAFPSLRHFWQECPRFQAERNRLCAKHGVTNEWFLRQPRCTSKSGWITMTAAAIVELRAAWQIAACELGLCMLQTKTFPTSASEQSDRP